MGMFGSEGVLFVMKDLFLVAFGDCLAAFLGLSSRLTLKPKFKSRGNSMEFLSIGEVASKAGIAASAIRFYERQGVLMPAQRRNGRRQYQLDILEHLRVIQMAQAVGFTMQEIRVLLHEFPAGTPPSVRWQAFASQKLAAIDALLHRVQMIRHILEQGMHCECATFTDCLAAWDASHEAIGKR
jgi:MerR family transcriptional regulator, redox-sensitive transcriptional activator SoxR